MLLQICTTVCIFMGRKSKRKANNVKAENSNINHGSWRYLRSTNLVSYERSVCLTQKKFTMISIEDVIYRRYIEGISKMPSFEKALKLLIIDVTSFCYVFFIFIFCNDIIRGHVKVIKQVKIALSWFWYIFVLLAATFPIDQLPWLCNHTK